MAKQGTNTVGLGVILILVGLFFLGVNLDLVHLSQRQLWPFFIIAPGILLLALAFGSRTKSTILPGVILTGVGSFFLLREFGFLPWSMDLLWPVFPGLVGLGFLVSYYFDSRNRGMLIPAVILLLISFIFFAINFHLLDQTVWQFWPSILILAGLALILSGK